MSCAGRHKSESLLPRVECKHTKVTEKFRKVSLPWKSILFMLSVALLMRWGAVLSASPPASCGSINLQEPDNDCFRCHVARVTAGRSHGLCNLCWSQTPQLILQISSSLPDYSWPLFLTCPYILPYKECKAQPSVALITLLNTRHAFTFWQMLTKKEIQKAVLCKTGKRSCGTLLILLCC